MVSCLDSKHPGRSQFVLTGKVADGPSKQRWKDRAVSITAHAVYLMLQGKILLVPRSF